MSRKEIEKYYRRDEEEEEEEEEKEEEEEEEESFDPFPSYLLCLISLTPHIIPLHAKATS